MNGLTEQEERHPWLKKYPDLTKQLEPETEEERHPWLKKYPSLAPEPTPEEPGVAKEPGELLFEKIKDIGSKILPFLKEQIPYIPEIGKAKMRGEAMRIEKERPEVPPETPGTTTKYPEMPIKYPEEMGEIERGWLERGELLTTEQFKEEAAKAYRRKLGLQYLVDLPSGTLGALSHMAGAADFFSKMLAQGLSKATGIPEDTLKGKLFENLSRDWGYYAQKLSEEGLSEGILKDVMQGIGAANVVIPAIQSIAAYTGPTVAFPLYTGTMGAAEAGMKGESILKGLAIGATEGALISGILHGIGMLPTTARMPAAFGFGYTTTPGEVKERFASGLVWAGLIGKGGKPLSLREFIENYPKISEKIDNRRAYMFLKKVMPGITEEQIHKEGGAKEILDRTYDQIENLKRRGLIEEPVIETPEIKPETPIINVKSQADGSVDISIKKPEVKPTETRPEIRPELREIKPRKARVYKDRLLQAIADEGGVVASEDFPRNVLTKVLPFDLVKARKAPGLHMDELKEALNLRHGWNFDYDNDLYRELQSRKRVPGKKGMTEKEYYEMLGEQMEEAEVEFIKPGIEYPSHAEEAGWSPEAISRAKKIQFLLYDTRTKKVIPIPGVDAVGPNPYQVKLERNIETGKINIYDKGDKAYFTNTEIFDIEKRLMEGAKKEVAPTPVSKEEFKFDPNSTRNEGRWRLQDPDLFEDHFRRKSSTPGVSYLMGKNKNTGEVETQSIRFNKNIISEKEAAEWWDKNKPRFKRDWTWKKEAVREEAKPIFEKTKELQEIEKALMKGEELSKKQKELLKEKGMYEELEPAKPEKKLEVIPKKEAVTKEAKMDLVRVSIETPIGTIEDLGEFPADKIDRVKSYAKKLGLESKMTISESRSKKWPYYLPWAEQEKYMKTIIRDVKTKPKKEWQKWQLYSGYPFTKEVQRAIDTIKARHKKAKKVKLEELKEELQKTDKGKVEWMYIETEMKLKDLRKPTFRKAFEAAKRATVDTSGNIKRTLLKDLGDLGKEAVIYHDLMAGASPKAKRIYAEAEKKIYKDLSKKKEQLLNRAIQSRRTIAILKYKPEHKRPHDLKTKEHEASLEDIPQDVMERAGLYFKEMEKNLKRIFDEGLMDKEEYEALKSKGDYSPSWYIQHLDPEISYTIGGKTITVPDSGIKPLEEGSVNNLEMNSRLMLSTCIERAEARIAKNKANRAAYNIAKDVPDNGIFRLAKVIKTTKKGKPIYETAPAGHTKIKFMLNGEPKEIIMPDKFAKEWVQRDPLINSTLANWIGWLSGSKLLKPMATGLNPGFAITNFPRDIAHVYLVTHEYSSLAPVFAFQMGRDLMATMKDAFLRKGSFIDYVNEYGMMDFLTIQGRPSKKVGGALKLLQDVMGYPGETSEVWVRLALRKRSIRNGKSPIEATWIARNYLDFAQGGNVAKAIDTGFPYFNATIQGTRRIFTAAADKPGEFIWKVAQLGGLATGLYFANNYMNPTCFNAISPKDKVNNWNVTTPFHIKDKNGNIRYIYFTFAKDQGQRIFCTIFEALTKKSLGEKIDVDEVTQAVQDFLPIIPGQDLPPTVDALMGYAANKDFWTNEEIWKGGKIKSREEYTVYTHPALREAGELLNLSPERLNYALSQVFTRGNVYTSLVSGGLNAAMKDSMSKEDMRKTTTEMIARWPIVRRVFKLTPPYSIKEIKEIKKAKEEEATRRYKQKRELQRMSVTYYRKLYDDKVRDTELRKEIKTFINDQPIEDRKRLDQWFRNYGIVYNIPEKNWWLNLTDMPPEARATVFWTKYIQSNKEEKKEMEALGKKIPGIWSDSFLRRFRTLMNKMEKENE